MIRDWVARAARLSVRTKLIVAGASGVFVLLLIGLFLVAGVGRGCSARDDVTARVSLVSSGLQQAAAQGKIKIEELAAGIRRLNDAATAYNTNSDHAAYCKALDQLGDEYQLEP